MGLLKWRCSNPGCRYVNNTVTFEDSAMVNVTCTFCGKDQVVERRGKTDTLHFGARRVA